MTLVSVALPVHRAADTLERAFRAIAHQTHTDLEILLVLNGADDATTSLAAGLVAGDTRARIITLPLAHLAAALNVALRESKGDLVARMDADDDCPPERIARQVAFLHAHPTVAAVGCAYHVVSAQGTPVFTVRPPTNPAEARWRLLLGNSLAHGSMLLRRAAVIGVGGYDERCARAQDYDLWLRLIGTHGIAALPEVLYTHTTRNARDASRSTPEQAEVAARALLMAWNGLGRTKALEELARAMVVALSQDADPSASVTTIEDLMAREGPSSEGLLAWLWARHLTPPASHRAADASRRARVREIARTLRDAGVKELWLWGAGDHTRQVLEHPEDFGMPVRGIVDDATGGEKFGLAVVKPDTLRKDDCVLLSSDWHEQAMWESSRPHRGRGVRVFRLYT